MWKKNMNQEEAAQLIERFLNSTSLYPQEWNDFVETRQENRLIESYRRQCEELDPLVNRPGEPDQEAVARLRQLIQSLRSAT